MVIFIKFDEFTQGVNFVFAVDEFLNGSCCRIEMKRALEPLKSGEFRKFPSYLFNQ